MNKYLKSYSVGVESPNVSGFEHLNTLMCRDKLSGLAESLTRKEKEQLMEADQRLIEQAATFFSELQRVTSLEYERQQRRVPPTHWWWYLDVIANLPIPAAWSVGQKASQPAEAAMA
jgi:hypothetical protein